MGASGFRLALSVITTIYALNFHTQVTEALRFGVGEVTEQGLPPQKGSKEPLPGFPSWPMILLQK